jgi:pyruvate decarboxylase
MSKWALGPARFNIQMQFGSIGWSVPAAIGAAVAAQRQGRRIINIVGDGAFHMTAQVTFQTRTTCLKPLKLSLKP